MSIIDIFSPIEQKILKVEERMRSLINEHESELEKAVDHLLSSGGKRIRPAISLLIGGMLGGNEKKLISLGAAIELLHTATLVHDDLIDGALLRRGIATINSKWSPAATVLTGDYIFAQAARLASETESVILMRRFSETLATIVNGELIQLFYSDIFIDRERYYKRIYAKTASLFELSAEAAAYLSPVGDQTIENMRKFGNELGMAFQIVDDILDFTGEQNTIGKPIASDLSQGLITLPAIIYFENNKNLDMHKYLVNVTNHINNLNDLIEQIKASGAIEKAMVEARFYVDSALRILSEQPNCKEHTSLFQLANYVVDRTY